MAAWASLTKLPMSRPRTLSSTAMRRRASSREICAGPSTSAISASCESGMRAPFGAVTSRPLIASTSWPAGALPRRAYFERLPDAERRARRRGVQRGRHLLGQLFSRLGRLPFGVRFQVNEDVSRFDPNRVSGDFGAPDLADDPGHFWETFQHPLGGGIGLDRLAQRDARQQARFERE